MKNFIPKIQARRGDVCDVCDDLMVKYFQFSYANAHTRTLPSMSRDRIF